MRLGDLIEHIVKVKGGYRLVSKKSGRNLGTYPTRAGAEKRERQVQYFKHAGESVEQGVAEDSEDPSEKFDIHGLDPVTKKLLISIRSKYPWAKTDLEALLTYIKDEDTTLEKDIDGLEHKDSEHDHEINDLDTEVDQEQTTIKQVKSAEDLQNAKIADIEKKVNAISSRIFGRD